MMALSAKDLTVVEGDARIADTHLQAVLGYGRINDLHVIIRQHEDELADFGEVVWRTAKQPLSGSFAGSAKHSKVKGGRPTVTCYLNDFQAALVCMFARTSKARSARKLIAEVFTAYHHGQLADLPGPAAADPFAAMAGRAGLVTDHLQAIAAMPALARNVTHLPVWANGRRPAWWADYDLRAFLTESHRQMTLAQCCAEVKGRFGRPFSASTLQRYWAKLDQAIGPGRAA